MRRALVLWGVVLTVAVCTGSSLAQPLPPPPAPASYKGRPIQQDLLRWHRNLTADCILAVRDDAQMARIAEKISKHPEQADRAAFAEYYNKVLLPAYQAAQKGVPGYGTFEEIDARRAAAMKVLLDGRPSGPAKTEVEVRAFVAACRAYADRAAEDRKWLKGLQAASTCHREQRFEKIPLLKGFHDWDRYTDPVMVRGRIAEVRDPLVPGFGGMARVNELLRQLGSPPRGLRQTGELLTRAAMLYKELGEVEASQALLPVWAEAFEGKEKEELLTAPARMKALRGQILEGAAKVIETIEPPAEPRPEKALAKTAAPLVKGRAGAVLTLRITSPSDTYEGDTTDEKDLGGGKVLVRKYRVKYEHFGVAFVGDVRPYEWWPDLPSLPAKEVCSLVIGVAKKYSKGLDVPMKKWLFYGGDDRIPILCKHKDRPGKPL